MARLPDFNPQDAAFLADPHGTFHELRRLEPVHWSSPLQSWILTRHADALAVLLDSETFAIGSAHAGGAVGRDIQRSSAGAPLPPTAMLTELDGPAHAKLRQHLASAFTPRALKPVRPSVRATAAGMLERSAGEPFEFVESLAMPLPILAAFALLGIHTEDQEAVYARASILMRAMQYADPRMRDQVARAREELDELVRTVLPRRVRRPGLLADLLDAREAGDLTQEELLGLIIFLCTVGQAPTAFAVSMAVLALLRHPDELARLRAEPDLLGGVLDEAVRFDSPTRLIRRFATSQTELGGVTIEAGQQIQIMVPAANRDPEVFADPDRFDISRGAQQHLSFGWGSHLCMGPHLTRIIAEEVIGLLLEEFPDLALGERLEMASGLFLGPAVMDLVGRRGMQVSQPARPVPVAKAGRNEACPCGSGKKYKRCHGAAA